MPVATEAYAEWTVVPRAAVDLPLALAPPESFDPASPQSWPRVLGRLEYVGGQLLYMPPCGGDQEITATDVTFELAAWSRSHPGFVVGSNEAGMMLGNDVRGADAAIWSAADFGAGGTAFPRVPPVLAVEVAGRDDTVDLLMDKAAWYLSHGVRVVWIVVPATRSVRVVTSDGARDFGAGQRLPENPLLPRLAPLVDDLFRQMSGL